MSEHISRKELKQDKVRETFEHGAEAVFSHTKLASAILIVAIVAAVGFFGWKFYNDRTNAQAQSALDEALKTYNAPILQPGQPSAPGEVSYADPAQRSAEAEPKLAAVAAKYPGTKAGRQARYYSALCLMDMDKLNQATEELSKLDSSSDKEIAALAKFQRALIAERTGKTDQAVQMLRELSGAGAVLVPKAMVQLELAGILRQTSPKEAANIYEQVKRDYPNTSLAEEAERGLGALPPQS